ncbi:MAG: hypothetical protein CMH11_18985 [Maritimibacter sp.]|nr:hypothetical protein [Maritimibacter sp.]
MTLSPKHLVDRRAIPLIEAQSCDTIPFVEAGFGHNVETIPGMTPAGVTPVKSPEGESFDLFVEEKGLCGLQTSMRYTLGMVARVQAGARGQIRTGRGREPQGPGP